MIGIKVYRWIYLEEGVDGIVVASTINEAKNKVREYLADLYKIGPAAIYDDDMSFWEARADEHYDNNHPDVLRCAPQNKKFHSQWNPYGF